MKRIDRIILRSADLLSLFRHTLPWESVADDLAAEYSMLSSEQGRLKAQLWFLGQIFFLLISQLLDRIYWRSIMIGTYFTMALRTMKKEKGYAFINITGLAIGLACTLMILAFVSDELSFDRFHSRGQNIYRITTDGHIADRVISLPMVPAGVGQAMAQDYPEVLSSVVLGKSSNELFTYKDRRFNESAILFADSAFFNIFSFELLEGDAGSVLSAPYSLVLTQSAARKYFGDDNAVGQLLTRDGQENFTVTGIVKDPPRNSHIQFSMLASFSTMYARNPDFNRWLGWNYYTYLLMDPQADIASFDEKLRAMNRKHIDRLIRHSGATIVNHLQPLFDIHLHSDLENELTPNSSIRTVYAFSAVAIFVLILACINFMNLSTARSVRRAREVGLRKVMGARQSMLRQQFLGESLMTTLLALAMALILCTAALPFFNQLTGRELTLNFLISPPLLLAMGVIVLAVAGLAGWYPAVLLSAFQPAATLRGRFKQQGRHARLRQILVVLQFSISITLIIGTAVVHRQLTYMQNKKLGFSCDQKLVIALNDRQAMSQYTRLKTELAKVQGVKGVCGSRMVPGEHNYSGDLYYEEGQSQESCILIETFTSDENFIPVYDIQMVEGRNFSRDHSTDADNGVILNETVVRKFNWSGSAVGRKMVDSINPDEFYTVVGVMKDIHYNSVQHSINPSMIKYRPDTARRITVQLETGRLKETMEAISEVWDSCVADRPMTSYFFDDYFNSLYQSEMRQGRLFQIFAIFTVVIACLGLFGLASFSAEQRTREIGIRKTLGASINRMVYMLCREFAILVIAANVLAWPAAYWIMGQWLLSFPYREGMHVGVFLASGLSALAVALATVGFKALQAAHANPVQALKHE